MLSDRKPAIVVPRLPVDRNGGVEREHEPAQGFKVRHMAMTLSVLFTCVAITFQLLNLAWRGQTHTLTTLANPIAQSFSRPDIVDRKGRLLATDVSLPSLFADPTRIVDRDAVVEQLSALMPDLDRAALRAELADTSKHFVWVRRGIAPKIAQYIHNLGLPGLAFKDELRRAYPAGKLAGHVLGAVNVDNKGMAGIERYIDTTYELEPVLGTPVSQKSPVQLSLDVGVQHVLDDELLNAVERYKAEGAAGVILDVDSGEVLAATSLPQIDPMQLAHLQDQHLSDKVLAGSYELGSVFKLFTVAMALDEGIVKPSTPIDVSKPLISGRHVIKDAHPSANFLSVEEVFTHSSNVGSAVLALSVGQDKHLEFLQRLNLTTPITSEAGSMAQPLLPEHWQRINQITIAYGHGIAVSPLQFAAAAAALINGGRYLLPTFLRSKSFGPVPGRQVITSQTSDAMRQLMRRNVVDRSGTGWRADVAGYDVGGKTGTAEVASANGYKKKQVISSFVAAFPMKSPRYLVLVSIFKPKGTKATGGAITASRNAAPVTGRIVKRIAPLLNVLPRPNLAFNQPDPASYN